MVFRFVFLVVSGSLAYRVEVDRVEGGRPNALQVQLQDRSCTDLDAMLQEQLVQATDLMTERNGGPESADALASAATQISAIADAADMKRCLPSVLNNTATHAAGERFHWLTMEFLPTAGSEESRSRTDQAYLKLQHLKGMILDFEHEMHDERLHLPTQDSPQEFICPRGCIECPLSAGSSAGGFKCIMQPGTSIPQGLVPHGFSFTCDESTLSPRSSNQNQMKVQCQQKDAAPVAAQLTFMSARVTCAALALLNPLQHGDEFSAAEELNCIKQRTGEALAHENLEGLKAKQNTMDQVVAPFDLAKFTLVFTVEITQAIAELRRRNVDPQRETSRQVGQSTSGGASPLTAVDGLLQCRKGLLSLGENQFTPVLSLAVAMAHLVRMSTVGLHPVMEVFGVDATFATFAEDIPKTTDEVISQYMSGTSRFAVRGAQQDVRSMQEVGSLQGDLGNMFADLNTQLENHWDLVLGNPSSMGASFGIHGVLQAIHAHSVDRDCGTGYFIGSAVICHPSIDYGQTAHKFCPNGRDGQAVFMCNRENQGVVTVSEHCH